MRVALIGVEPRMRVMRLHEPWWIEVWSGITAVCWARFVLWMPLDLEERQPYAVLTGIATDGQWEWAGFMLGALQIAVAVADWRRGRWVIAFLMAWFWICLGYGIWLADQSAPGSAVYLWWGAANMTSMALLFRPHAR